MFSVLLLINYYSAALSIFIYRIKNNNIYPLSCTCTEFFERLNRRITETLLYWRTFLAFDHFFKAIPVQII